jgi:hypothetical protein
MFIVYTVPQANVGAGFRRDTSLFSRHLLCHRVTLGVKTGFLLVDVEIRKTSPIRATPSAIEKSACVVVGVV